jgi:hypothetical protein
MKLSEYKGEQALDMLADLIEPVTAIMADKEIARMAKAQMPVIKVAKLAIKNHKKEVIEILAILDGADPKNYAEKVNLFTLPAKLMEILNDPDVMSLFTLQGQKTVETSSGSATESITASGQ